MTERLREISVGTMDRAIAAIQHIGIDPRTAPRPRDRRIIESASVEAAKAGSTCATHMLQTEVLLDIRDLLGECVVRLSTIEAQVSKP